MFQCSLGGVQLAFMQVQSGKLALKQERVSLAEVMLECRAMMEPQASQRAITTAFPPLQRPYYVRADPTRVKQVVINLLSNAIKYNKAQGAVTVEVALSPPDAIRVSVRDTGKGLAPEQLAQFSALQPDFVAANHCTGFSMMSRLHQVFGDRFIPAFVGSVLAF